MDRNLVDLCLAVVVRYVATREGGVDRNYYPIFAEYLPVVATREGGVDRNTSEKLYSDDGVESPPARVAWIETPKCCGPR